MAQISIADLITDIPDYPKPGVVFKDITTLLSNPEGFTQVVDSIAEHFAGSGVTKVMGAEARGFVIAAPVAYKLGAGFVPVRKPGKLPRATFVQKYDLEYGTDCLEMHQDALNSGDVVLMVDDLIATGGTAIAQVKLAERCGATLAGMGFLTELEFLNPREALAAHTDAELFSLVQVK